MTDFQVGDRVSVEGVVTQLWPDAKPGPLTLVRVVGEGYEDDSELWFADQALTLVDRPRRKLRVGSVWQVPGNPNERYTVTGFDKERNCEVFSAVDSGVFYFRDDLTFDESRSPWREVPVEELAREVEP